MVSVVVDINRFLSPLRKENQMKITPQQKQEYDENGFFIARNLIPPRQLNAISERLNMAALGKLDPNIVVQVEPEVQKNNIQADDPLDRIRKVKEVVRYDPFFKALAADGNILELMHGVLGDNIRFFDDECQLKPAHYGFAHLWHQDAPYFHHRPMPVATLWIAVDDATRENGCVEVVPGLHRQGIIQRRNADKPWFEAEEFDTSNAVHAVLKAGDAIVFDLLLPHGSGPNKTPNRRRAVIYRYANVGTLTPEVVEIVERQGGLTDDENAPRVFSRIHAYI